MLHQFPAAARWTITSPCWWHNSPGRWTEQPPQRLRLEPHTWTPTPSWPRRGHRAANAPSRRTWSHWPRAEWWRLTCVLWCWRKKFRRHGQSWHTKSCLVLEKKAGATIIVTFWPRWAHHHRRVPGQPPRPGRAWWPRTSPLPPG